MATGRTRRARRRERRASDGGVVPFWSGTISFGLVSIPVVLAAAHRARDRGLRMLAPDGAPLRRQYVCPAHGAPVSAGDIVRGYPLGSGEVVPVTDDELASLDPRKSRDIQLLRFVDRGALPPALLSRAYYVVPGGESAKAYSLLATILEQEGRAAIATFVMRGKEHAVALTSAGNVLRAHTLRFADELRSATDVGLPATSEPDPAAARRIDDAIDALTRDALDPAELRDDSTRRLHALAADKLARGQDLVDPPDEAADEVGGDAGDAADAGGDAGDATSNVVDIMQLLVERLGSPPPPDAAPTRRGGAARTRRKDADGGGEPARAKPARGADALAERTRKELYEQAQALDIAGRSKMSKDELIRAIRRSA